MVDTKYIQEKLGWVGDIEPQLERISRLRKRGLSISQIAKLALEGKIPLDTSAKNNDF